MEFFIIGWLCSPFLQECVSFQGPKKFDSKIICQREATIVKRDMKNRLRKKDFVNKIYITCKEKRIWLQ